MGQKPGAAGGNRARVVRIERDSHVGVTGAQHGGKPGRLHFPAPPFTGLFEMPVVAHFLQSAFAVDLFLQTPQRLVNRFPFFQSNFGQELSLPLYVPRVRHGHAINGRLTCNPPANMSTFNLQAQFCMAFHQNYPKLSWKSTTCISCFGTFKNWSKTAHERHKTHEKYREIS